MTSRAFREHRCARLTLEKHPSHRQRFLAEQGYAYRIVDADDLTV